MVVFPRGCNRWETHSTDGSHHEQELSFFFVIIPLLRLTSKLFINILLLLMDEKSQLERGRMLYRLPFRPFLCLFES